MNGPAMLADHLDAQTDSIIAVWRKSVEKIGKVPEAGILSSNEFADHIPLLLDRLAERLRGRPADAALAAQKHGRMRWRQGYHASEIIDELGELRTILMRATFRYAREHEFDPITLEGVWAVICEVFNEATAEAVAHFQQLSADQARAAMEEVAQRQRDLEAARHVAEAAQARLHTVVDNLPVGVWVTDAQGQIVNVNREAERLEGVPAAEMIGHYNVHEPSSEFAVFHPDGTRYELDQLPSLRALRGEVVSQEEIVWQLAGKTRIVTVNAAPMTDGTAAIIGAVTVAQDITERKLTEAHLAASEARFRSIAEQSPVMIWRTGPGGHCDYVNQTYLEFRGRSLAQVIGTGWTEGIHPDDIVDHQARFRAAFARHEPFEQTFRMLRHDGQYRWITSRGTPYHDNEGAFLGYLASSIDITERIDLEKALEQQRGLAEESSSHKTRLLAAMSHDARTPLNAVGLAAQLLEMHCKPLHNPEVDECLRTIRHSVGNVLELLGDLLNLTKIDAGALPAKPSRFALEPVLTESLASIETQARLKGLDVRLEPGALAGAVVETDRSKLKQILCNLLSNALRYTEKGHIRVFGELADDQIRIAVEDTGIGIASTDQQRVFDEFATLSSHHRPTGEGTGLGLAICRRLANLLKGEISLQSSPGEGSTFTLVLPASVLSDGPAEHATPPSTEGDAAGSGLILVAEDHLTSRQTLAKVLRRMGYRVAEAGNGRDALAIVRRERPLAILMDVNMPVMDGIDATLALRADPQFREIPIFALTGDVSVLNQRRIGEAGVNGYLEKPITWEILRQALAPLKGV
ncbi:MAG TPA: PAS domain S-box protein [Isosphaeraceae bacterium]|jgi:two-component system CheB/CheR fusion protein|nr:PAS domain S-box protein [Isosphaeraceae bacterium]